MMHGEIRKLFLAYEIKIPEVFAGDSNSYCTHPILPRDKIRALENWKIAGLN